MLDARNRILFFDTSYNLKMIEPGSKIIEQIEEGEYWEGGKQIRINSKRTRLLFRKSDNILLLFDVEYPQIERLREIDLFDQIEGSITDFNFFRNNIYMMTSDGYLRIRGKKTKNLVIDKGGQYFCVSCCSNPNLIAISSDRSKKGHTYHSLFLYANEGKKLEFLSQATFMTDEGKFLLI